MPTRPLRWRSDPRLRPCHHLPTTVRDIMTAVDGPTFRFCARRLPPCPSCAVHPPCLPYLPLPAFYISSRHPPANLDGLDVPLQLCLPASYHVPCLIPHLTWRWASPACHGYPASSRAYTIPTRFFLTRTLAHTSFLYATIMSIRASSIIPSLICALFF